MVHFISSSSVSLTTPSLIKFLFIFLISSSLVEARTLEPSSTKTKLKESLGEGLTLIRVKRDSEASLLVSRSGDQDEVEEGGGSSPASLTSGKFTDIKDGYVPLPPGYNKLVIPTLSNVSDALFILVDLSIREILDVDQATETLELDTELSLTWIDWKIWDYWFRNQEEIKKHMNVEGVEEMILDSEFLKHIWKPDIYIDEMASISRTSILSKLITLKFLVKNSVIPGAITFQSRQNIKLRCDMDFHYYPADTQNCEYTIRSFSYENDKLFLMWNPEQSVFLNEGEDPNHDFQISNVEPGEEFRDVMVNVTKPCCDPKVYSALTFTIKIRRNLTYHLVQTYLPSVLLILITWLCFLLPMDLVEARIGISMTTVLTLTAMFASVRETSPEVSYPMAIDRWMVFCIIMVFIALVLFTFVFWMKRKMIALEEAKDSEEWSEQKQKYANYLTYMKKHAFLFFALIFVVFVAIYSIWLLNASEHFDWEPNPKYNAIEDDDGELVDGSIRLFSPVEDPFDPAIKGKKIQMPNRGRFKHIALEVIAPRLPPDSDEEEGEYYEEEPEGEEHSEGGGEEGGVKEEAEVKKKESGETETETATEATNVVNTNGKKENETSTSKK